jgi:RNA polymerase sigma factor (sigma-70 family)
MSGQIAVTTVTVKAEPTDRTERLAALYDAHEDRLYRLARRLVSSAEDARDLLQETFLRAAKSAKSIPSGLPSEEAWLVRILINIRRDQWRKADVRRRYASLETNPTISDSNLESALIAKQAVWRALDVLPPRRRAIVVLYELEGERVPAIARLLGVSAITVRWHLSVGRRQLLQVLKPGDTR